MKIENIVIVAAKRTPIGKFDGAFSGIPAHLLGAKVVKNLFNNLNKNVAEDEITELIAGQILTAGAGQNPARQTSVLAGLPFQTSAFTINHMCGSGLKSILLGCQHIMIENSAIIIAGGQENMSMAQHVAKIREFKKIGNLELVDTMLCDGLIDAFHNYHMGITAENLVKKYNITRNAQDEFAYNSQQKAIKALKENKFKKEIIPIEINGKTIEKDESVRFDIRKEDLAKLKPAFKKDGTVTAGNSSSINDGAAFVMLMHKTLAEKKDLEILGNVVSAAECGIEPEIMGIAPVIATKKALNSANWKIKDLDLIELNEAFAAQSLAVINNLKLDLNKVNINGGAIALGHPIATSGARCLVTLLHAMKQQNAKKGLVTLCIGGGMGIAMCIQK